MSFAMKERIKKVEQRRDNLSVAFQLRLTSENLFWRAVQVTRESSVIAPIT
jgi:hypothetical protein